MALAYTRINNKIGNPTSSPISVNFLNGPNRSVARENALRSFAGFLKIDPKRYGQWFCTGFEQKAVFRQRNGDIS